MIEKSSINKKHSLHLTRRLVNYLRPYRISVVVSVMLLAAYSCFAVAGPYLTKIIIDQYLQPVDQTTLQIDTWFSRDYPMGFDTIALIYLGILFLGFLIRYGQIVIVQQIGQKIMKDLRMQVFTHLHTMNTSFGDRSAMSRLTTQITVDVETLNAIFNSGIVTLFSNLLTFVFVLIVMTHLSPELTVVCCAVAPLVFTAYIWFRKHARKNFQEAHLVRGKIADFLQEHFTGMATVQLFGHEAKSKQEFDQINNKCRVTYCRATQTHAYFHPTTEWLGVLVMGTVLVYGGTQVINGSLTLGAVVAFIQYGALIFRPTQDVGEKYNTLQLALAGAERIFVLLDTPANQSSPTKSHRNDSVDKSNL